VYIARGGPEWPRDLREAAQAVHGCVKGAVQMRDRLRAPSFDNVDWFMVSIAKHQRDMAEIITFLTEIHEELQEAGKDREKESKRWQANYDLILARVEAELIVAWEYTGALARMRKGFPPRDPAIHTGWILAHAAEVTSGAVARKLARERRERLDRIAADHAGTPWEVLAKREKLILLGLEWKASR
jgi:hypothetical protein